MEDVIALIVMAVTIGLVVALIMALPVMLLWNVLMPDLFGLTTITFWQALGISVLCSILFKSSSSSSKS